MPTPNANTIHPRTIIRWLLNEADSFEEEGEPFAQNMLHDMADKLDQLYHDMVFGPAPKESAWIPTGETIPQNCTKVLVSYQTNGGQNRQAVAWFDRGLWWLSATYALDRVLEPVNYWMSLPKDPA